jgi:hypothetical protein
VPNTIPIRAAKQARKARSTVADHLASTKLHVPQHFCSSRTHGVDRIGQASLYQATWVPALSDILAYFTEGILIGDSAVRQELEKKMASYQVPESHVIS